MTFPSLAEWQLEAIRLIFISHAPVSGAQKNWWEDTVGRPPDSIATRPAQMEHHETGIVDDLELSMTTRFNHVEWMLRPVQSPPVAGQLPALGSVDEAMSRLKQIILPWVIKSEVPFHRLAFCPVLFCPAEDLAQASRIVAMYFPGFQGVDVEDLGGQFNIPKRSTGFPEVRINRILKINSGQIQTFTVGASPVPVIENQFVARMELDFNTEFQRSDPIPTDVFSNLLDEMQREAIQVASKGLI